METQNQAISNYGLVVGCCGMLCPTTSRHTSLNLTGLRRTLDLFLF